MLASIAQAALLVTVWTEARQAAAGDRAARIENIRAYSLDFNWGEGRRFAQPGRWSSADPAEHVAWYKAIGANVIQTFAVSCNGYAWYKNGVVPEQPGLLTCLAHWNRQDATSVVPQALDAGVGLYGFTRPRTDGGLVPLEPVLSRSVGALRGDDRNIAVLARAYHGVSLNAVWKDGVTFVETDDE